MVATAQEGSNTRHWDLRIQGEDMILTPETFSRLGWVEKNDVWTYTEVVNGNKFRIGWHSVTHKCYIGYGELPIRVETDWHLLAILRVCGLEEQVLRYLAVVK